MRVWSSSLQPSVSLPCRIGCAVTNSLSNVRKAPARPTGSSARSPKPAVRWNRQQNWRFDNPDTDPVPLEGVRVVESSWRVSDADIEKHDPTRHLGCITRRRSDRLGASRVSAPLQWAWFAGAHIALLALPECSECSRPITSERNRSDVCITHHTRIRPRQDSTESSRK